MRLTFVKCIDVGTTFYRSTDISFPVGFKFTWWKFTGGLLGVVYVTAVVIATPRIGAANTMGLSLRVSLWRLLLLINFGLLGLPVHSISGWRIAGIVILIIGVYLIQKK